MDKFFHFLFSLGLTALVLAILLSYLPAMRNLPPRLWHADQQSRKGLITLFFALAILFGLTVGIWKEWADSFGWGNVEFLDVVADLAGIVLGIYLIFGLVRRSNRRRPKVVFRSSLRSSSRPRAFLFKKQSSEAASRTPHPGARINPPNEAPPEWRGGE